ncbi:hypothetical protein BDV36DRAFT_269397 [Aspergillus pseudocaelatus]|uniref:Secreted protein n=1 Tax=Aspergillus pseudocaelatus TaxID=1825620 RepID=A0ABQ6W7N0_9EURO|nr:hypothetical protein BDV36DRAFT_269397 [Aspergillus pseudocaelatus]
MGGHLWQTHVLWLPVASSACWLLMFSTILHSGTNMPFVSTQRHPLRRHLLRPVDVYFVHALAMCPANQKPSSLVTQCTVTSSHVGIGCGIFWRNIVALRLA